MQASKVSKNGSRSSKRRTSDSLGNSSAKFALTCLACTYHSESGKPLCSSYRFENRQVLSKYFSGWRSCWNSRSFRTRKCWRFDLEEPFPLQEVALSKVCYSLPWQDFSRADTTGTEQYRRGSTHPLRSPFVATR